MPKVSIIIPIYNSQDYLEQTLESVRAQSFADFEALLIDNMSTDGSPAIEAEFAEGDSRFKRHLCEKPGVSSARNFGLEHASGEYIFFLDSDDLLVPRTLARLVTCLEDMCADIAVCDILHFDERRGIPQTKSAGEKAQSFSGNEKYAMAARLYEKRVFEFLFKLFSRKMIEENRIRFDENLSLGEDRMYMLDAFGAAKSVAYAPEVLYLHRVRKGSLGYKYRPNMAEISFYLQRELVKWFTEAGAYDLETQRICDGQFITGVCASIAHELQKAKLGGETPRMKAYRRAAASVFDRQEVRELCGRRQEGIGLQKRAAVFSLRHRLLLPFLLLWKLVVKF